MWCLEIIEIAGALLVPYKMRREVAGRSPVGAWSSLCWGSRSKALPSLLCRWTGAFPFQMDRGWSCLLHCRPCCSENNLQTLLASHFLASTVSLPRLTGTSRKNSCLQVCPPPVLSTAVLMPSLSLGLGLSSSLLPNTSSPYCVTVELRIIGWVHAHNPSTLGGWGRIENLSLALAI